MGRMAEGGKRLKWIRGVSIEKGPTREVGAHRSKLSLRAHTTSQREASPPCNPKPFRQSPMKDGRVRHQETLTWPDSTPGSATMWARSKRKPAWEKPLQAEMS